MSRKAFQFDLTATLRQVRDPVITVECGFAGAVGS